MIISLYAGGMTIRDIEHQLGTTVGTELSFETISKITDEVVSMVFAPLPIAVSNMLQHVLN